MKTLTFCLAALAALIFSGISRAQVPQIINDQGRVAVGTTNFNGTGAFKFAFGNPVGTTTTGSEIIVWGGQGFNGHLNDTFSLSRVLYLYQRP